MEGAAYEGLLDAATKFTPDKGKFGPYASRRISGQILDYLRGWGHHNRFSEVTAQLVPLCVPDMARYNERYLESESVQQPNKIEPWMHTKDFFIKISKILTDQEREVLWLYYVEDVTLKRIGNRLGVCESRVHQIMKKVKVKLLSHYGEKRLTELAKQ